MPGVTLRQPLLRSSASRKRRRFRSYAGSQRARTTPNGARSGTSIDHIRSKNRHAIIPGPFAQAGRHPDELHRGFDALAESGTIDILKRLGFYTDCLGDANWSRPESMIEQQLAEQIVGIAFVSVESGYRHTAKEIELWIAHMGPVMDKPVQWMKTALVNWQSAMAEHGPTDADPNVVEQLVRGASRVGA